MEACPECGTKRPPGALRCVACNHRERGRAPSQHRLTVTVERPWSQADRRRLLEALVGGGVSDALLQRARCDVVGFMSPDSRDRLVRVFDAVGWRLRPSDEPPYGGGATLRLDRASVLRIAAVLCGAVALAAIGTWTIAIGAVPVLGLLLWDRGTRTEHEIQLSSSAVADRLAGVDVTIWEEVATEASALSSTRVREQLVRVALAVADLATRLRTDGQHLFQDDAGRIDVELHRVLRNAGRIAAAADAGRPLSDCDAEDTAASGGSAFEALVAVTRALADLETRFDAFEGATVRRELYQDTHRALVEIEATLERAVQPRP